MDIYQPPRTVYPVGVNETIREAIRAEIAKTGLSQAEVARRMGLKPQELSRALKTQGKIAPVWMRILDHFNLELTVKAKVETDAEPEPQDP